MARGVTRHHPAMKRYAPAVQSQHERHRRIAVAVRSVEHFLRQDRKLADGGFMILLAARDGRRRDHLLAAIDPRHLVRQADDHPRRPLGGNVGDPARVCRLQRRRPERRRHLGLGLLGIAPAIFGGHRRRDGPRHLGHLGGAPAQQQCGNNGNDDRLHGILSLKPASCRPFWQKPMILSAYASMMTGLPVWVSVNSRAANFIGSRMHPWLAA